MKKNHYEYYVPLIEYCSALCAAGKTEAIVNRTVELVRAGEMVIIAQLSIRLLLQTAERLREKGVFVVDMHSDNTKQVGRAVYDTLRTPMDTGHVLLITHQCLFGLRDIPAPYHWHLFIDETPQIHQFEVIEQPLLAHELTDHLELIPLGPKLAALAVTDWNAIRKLEEKGNIDTGYEDLGLVAKRLRREWLAWVDPAKYQQFIDGNRTKLELMLMVSPGRLSGFKSVTICAAFFEETLTYKLWEGRVRFQESTSINKLLRYTTHDNGAQLQICYLTEWPWSKCFRECNQRVKPLIRDVVLKTFGDKPFLFSLNKDTPDNFFNVSNGIKLPNNPEGLNSFQGVYDKIVFLPALNFSQDQYAMLAAFGIPKDVARMSSYYFAAYQAVMRTSLRDLSNDRKKMIIIPDKGVAE